VRLSGDANPGVARFDHLLSTTVMRWINRRTARLVEVA